MVGRETWTSISESQGIIYHLSDLATGLQSRTEAYFAIPPPAQQCPMHYPRISPKIRHCKEIGLHRRGKVCPLVVVR